jgi:hypothetical protein
MINIEIVAKISERITAIIDPSIVALMGIVLQIFGVIFLSYESLGEEWFKKRFITLEKFSQWYKKSLRRMIIIISSIYLGLLLGFIFNVKFLIALIFPVILFTSLFFLMIDHPLHFKKWVEKKHSERKIGPKGFILIVIGGILQIVYVLIKIGI